MRLQVVCTGKLVVALCHKRTQGRRHPLPEKTPLLTIVDEP